MIGERKQTVSQPILVEFLRKFKANARDAFYSVDSRTYAELRDGYLDQNLRLTPAGYSLLSRAPGGMSNA